MPLGFWTLLGYSLGTDGLICSICAIKYQFMSVRYLKALYAIVLVS